MDEQIDIKKQEEEVEIYCEDSDEEIPEEHENDMKRLSIDEHINQLTSDILVQKDIVIDYIPSSDKNCFQDKVDLLISQMRGITDYVNTKCGMIDKMNILMCILTFKIYDIQHTFNIKLDELGGQRENIVLSKGDENLMPLELLNLDRTMREIQQRHHEISKGYKQQKIDMQLEYEKTISSLDRQLEIMKRNFNLLSEEHEHFTEETKRSEPILIDYIIQSALEEYSVIIEQYDQKRKKGWKSLYGDEEMLDILQNRGLAVSKSGYILTEGGEKLSYDEAEKRKLLEGLNFREKLIPKDLKENEDIVPSASSVQTIEGSEKDSLASQISTEDVSYLKETLGKPLTLALAEITSKQPRDPIHYLGHWLFKYRYNQELDVTQKQEYEALMMERNRLLKEKLHRLYEEEAKLVIFEMINNAENEAIKRELERILREQVMGGEEEEDDQATREYAELKKLLKIIQRTTESR